jgi:hypothetical protein
MTRKKLHGIFTENGEISWRKIMTAGALVSFLTSVFGYLIVHHFNELPPSYQAIIAGVFGFYFIKSFFRDIKIGKDVTKI